MSEVEKVALGLRLSGREAIEYVVMEMENANGLLDTLHRDHGYQPTGAFGDLAEGRQLTRAGDSIRFHDQARRAGATRWFLHQGGEWQGGVAKRRGGPSLASRWHNVAAAFGGDRFLPGRLRLNEDEAGLRRHCILGVLVELFRDDYPTALNLLTSPEGGAQRLRRTRQERDLPDQPAAGGTESGGADHLPGGLPDQPPACPPPWNATTAPPPSRSAPPSPAGT